MDFRESSVEFQVENQAFRAARERSCKAKTGQAPSKKAFDAFVKNEKGKERPATERQKRQEKCHTMYGKTEADYL